MDQYTSLFLKNQADRSMTKENAIPRKSIFFCMLPVVMMHNILQGKKVLQILKIIQGN